MTTHTDNENFLIEDLGDEVVVFDQLRDRAHRLNRAAAFVWRHSGEKSVSEIAALLPAELNLPADEDIVWLALDRLDKAHLLPETPVRPIAPEAVTRRAVLRKLALAGGLTMLLPVVQTIVAPTPAMAASFGCAKEGQQQTGTRMCCPGLHPNAKGICHGS